MRTAVLAALGCLACSAVAAPFTPGNVLVSTGNYAPVPNTISEYTRYGVFVQSITVPKLEGQIEIDYNRGMAVDHKGRLHVFNGSVKVGISTYDPATSQWTSELIPGLSVSGGGDYGKIAVYKDYVFLPDHDAGSGGEPMGIVRYNVAAQTWTRFALPPTNNDGPIDLTIGPDGLLYSLIGEGSPSGRSIDVWNPDTLAFVRSIDLSQIAYGQGGGNGNALRVRPDGNFLNSQLYSPCYLLDRNGLLLNTFTFNQSSYAEDFDLASDGTTMIVNRDGRIYLYSDAFGFIRYFETSNYYASDSFGCFVPDDVVALTVQSANPATGVPITVWKSDVHYASSGSTAFSRYYKTGVTVPLTAPTNVGGQYFDHWEKDGISIGTTKTISVAMGASHIVKAVFLKAFNITVRSENPSSGVPITVWTVDELGRGNGTTALGRTYTQGTVAKFTAPQLIGDNYFVQWKLDGASYAQTGTVALTVTASKTLTAQYATGVTLTVQASESAVPITVWTRDKRGQQSGTTTFTRLYAAATNVAMTAPATANGKAFIRWEKDGAAVPGTAKTVNVAMDAAHTMKAVYAP